MSTYKLIPPYKDRNINLGFVAVVKGYQRKHTSLGFVINTEIYREEDSLYFLKPLHMFPSINIVSLNVKLLEPFRIPEKNCS